MEATTELKCILCNPPRAMVSEGALKTHRTRHHKDVIKEVADDGRSFWCHCGKGFTYKRGLDDH